MAQTPAVLGYRMPAEWEPHSATWVSWPKDPDTFPAEILPAVESAYVQMVRALSEGEEVRVLVDDEGSEGRAKSLLGPSRNVSFHRCRTVDVWVRDYGPIYITGPSVGLTKWRFNAWGNKYEDLKPDDLAGDRIAEEENIRTFKPGLVLEGGSIDVNGRGTLLTTEQCLLNPNRNPGLDRAGIETALKENLGVKKVVWLSEGIEGDDTDGHVDDIARFVGPRTVLVAQERSRSDPNHRVLEDNRRVLEASTDQDGSKLEVVGIPMPPRVESAWGRLPASHANFYIGNSAVLVPTFGGASDDEALEILSGLFKERKVIGIDSRSLVHGLGGLHCVTQQIPLG